MTAQSSTSNSPDSDARLHSTESVHAASPLDLLAKRIGEISTLPQVAMRACEIANDPRSSASELKIVLEGDPALTSRVLRTVNSTFTGITSKVQSVQQAISLLGFTQIRNLAVTAAVAEIFRKDEEVERYSRKRLWRHLVSVAMASRMIAQRFGLARFEEAFLAGLLHDVGIILLDQYEHETFVGVIRTVAPGGRLSAVETERLGFDHAELGERVAKRWGFPETAVSAIRYHHVSEMAPAVHRPIVRAVELANYLCASKGITSIGLQAIGKPAAASLAALGVGRDEFRVLWEDFDQELGKAHHLINI